MGRKSETTTLSEATASLSRLGTSGLSKSQLFLHRLRTYQAPGLVGPWRSHTTKRDRPKTLASFTKPIRYLRRAEVEFITGHATSTLYRLIAHSKFPRPYSIGHGTVGWKESEVLAWCKTRKPRNRKDGLIVNAADLIGGSDE